MADIHSPLRPGPTDLSSLLSYDQYMKAYSMALLELGDVCKAKKKDKGVTEICQEDMLPMGTSV